MDALATADFLQFEGSRLDLCARRLFQQDQSGIWRPVAIGSRALDILAVLVERQGSLLTKGQIMAAAWPETVVEDNNLAVQISALRRVLDRDRTEGSCIQTVPGRGYRFVVPVTRRDPDVVTANVPRSNNGDEIAAAEERPQAPGRPDEWAAFGLLTRRFPWRGGAALLVSVLVVLGAVMAAWNWRSHSSGEARPAPRLSIVVLPFTNLGGSPEQQYFADGVTEDLTTDLSRIAYMVVISADTAFAFRTRSMDVRNIGRELGVRYVLEGSVQRSGQQIRVNAQLIDAETDTHLWADRFDREASDLLLVQDEITSRIAQALGVELIGREAAQPAQNPDVLDYIVRARAAINEPRTPVRYVEAISLLERALALDPVSVEVKSRLAIAHIGRVLDEMSASVAADIAVAEQLIEQVLAASPRTPLSHFAKAKLLRATHRCEDAIPEYETVLASDRNMVSAIADIGRCKIYVGPIEEAIPLEQRAIRLSPRDPGIAVWYFRIGQAHLLQSRIEDAIIWLERARSEMETLPFVHAYLAAAYALEGESERAAGELAEARKLGGAERYSSISLLRASSHYEAPIIRSYCEATFYAGLRKAGVPEE